MLQVARDQLPFIVNGGVPRDKRSVGFSRIRISTHFVEPLHAAVREQLTSPMGPFAKALELLSSTLLVRQVQGNLTVQPECDQYAFGPNNGKCWVLHSSTECGPFPIPDRYLGTREVCTSSDGPCDEEGPRGSGAEETDFLLLVGTQNESKDFCALHMYMSTILPKSQEACLKFLSFSRFSELCAIINTCICRRMCKGCVAQANSWIHQLLC